jgi:hypothetical protein
VDDPVRIHVRPALREPTLVLAFEGWNDAGEAASGAVRYVADAIAAAPLAEIDPEPFFDFTVQRPSVEVDGGGVRRIVWPTARFLYGSADLERELVVGIGVEPHLRWRSYVDHVAELVASLGVGRVVLLGAHLADVLYSRPVSISGFASPPGLLEELGVAPSSYEGPTGIVGVLADRLARDGAEVLSVWAALPHYISAQPNPRGSLALVQVLQRALSLKLDAAPLARSAAEFEERIAALVAADPELSEYVRELKRREFAQ